MILYLGDALRRYTFGHGHPFSSRRLDAFWDELCRRGLDAWVEVREPVEASRTEVERFHTPQYIDWLIAQSRSGSGVLDVGDTPVFPGIYEAACVIVGTTLAACEAVMSDQDRYAFIPIAGLHHARRDSASGFCALNDCGVAIATLEQIHHLERIAYVDIDVHHGDGVFYAFECDPRVIFADVHEDGRFLFPGTGTAHERGRGAADGTKLNIPLPPGAGDDVFHAAWERVEGFIDALHPQMVLFQCGADALADDPLADLRYSSASHARAASGLKRIVQRHGSRGLVAMGGGGYNPRNVASAWCAVVESLLDDNACRCSIT